MNREGLARLVTDALAPGYVLIGLLLVMGWRSTGTAAGLGWGLLAGLCGGGGHHHLVEGVGAHRGGGRRRGRADGGVRALLLLAFLAGVVLGVAAIGAVFLPLR
jgi:hypothetical protein